MMRSIKNEFMASVSSPSKFLQIEYQSIDEFSRQFYINKYTVRDALELCSLCAVKCYVQKSNLYQDKLFQNVPCRQKLMPNCHQTVTQWNQRDCSSPVASRSTEEARIADCHAGEYHCSIFLIHLFWLSSRLDGISPKKRHLGT